MKLSDCINALEAIAPTAHAETWDNVGLIAGDPRQDIAAAMLTIDYTAPVAAEASAAGCDLVIAYHPPIFSPIKRLVAGHLVYDAIANGIAIYSPHTAWDIAPGGTNDFLADVLGMTQRAPLKPTPAKPTQLKLVTFVPAEHVESLSNALFDVGAGRIGDYSQCSYRLAGTGTFFGGAGTNPAVGERGKLETVQEIRLEMVVPVNRVDSIVAALRSAHPYEEPAFDLLSLAAAPDGLGQGRIGPIVPASRGAVIERIKNGLGLEHLLVAGPTDGMASTVACCAGSCSDLLKDAVARRADLYLTGELRHHDALAAATSGMTVICTLHSNSERASLTRLRDRLQQHLPALPIHLSRADRDPFAVR
jgi:dinuclear metal center YbgI/SA1388 family protein